MPSRRDLVAALVACAESDEDGGRELEQLLTAYSSALAEALGITSAKLLPLCGMAVDARRNRVQELVRAAQVRRQSAAVTAALNLSVAAATMLTKLARWEGARVVLDPRIVLGRSLLADRSRCYVRFDAEDLAVVVVRREKLVEASKALKFPDTTCALEARGLRFTWRAGRGGLLLTNQDVEARHRDAVLHVVMPKPRPATPVAAAPPMRERTTSWAPDLFGELSIF